MHYVYTPVGVQQTRKIDKLCVCVCVCVFAPPSVLDRNGVIVACIVSYGKEGAGPDDVRERDFPSTGEDPQRITLTELDSNSTYLYTVEAATAEGAGTASFQRSFMTAGQGKAFSTGS